MRPPTRWLWALELVAYTPPATPPKMLQVFNAASNGTLELIEAWQGEETMHRMLHCIGSQLNALQWAGRPICQGSGGSA